MKPRDSFLERLQPIDDLTNLMDRNNRFKRRKNDKSTIGCALVCIPLLVESELGGTQHLREKTL